MNKIWTKDIKCKVHSVM